MALKTKAAIRTENQTAGKATRFIHLVTNFFTHFPILAGGGGDRFVLRSIEFVNSPRTVCIYRHGHSDRVILSFLRSLTESNGCHVKENCADSPPKRPKLHHGEEFTGKGRRGANKDNFFIDRCLVKWLKVVASGA